MEWKLSNSQSLSLQKKNMFQNKGNKIFHREVRLMIVSNTIDPDVSQLYIIQ